MLDIGRVMEVAVDGAADVSPVGRVRCQPPPLLVRAQDVRRVLVRGRERDALRNLPASRELGVEGLRLPQAPRVAHFVGPAGGPDLLVLAVELVLQPQGIDLQSVRGPQNGPDMHHGQLTVEPRERVIAVEVGQHQMVREHFVMEGGDHAVPVGDGLGVEPRQRLRGRHVAEGGGQGRLVLQQRALEVPPRARPRPGVVVEEDVVLVAARAPHRHLPQPVPALGPGRLADERARLRGGLPRDARDVRVVPREPAAVPRGQFTGGLREVQKQLVERGVGGPRGRLNGIEVPQGLGNGRCLPVNRQVLTGPPPFGGVGRFALQRISGRLSPCGLGGLGGLCHGPCWDHSGAQVAPQPLCRFRLHHAVKGHQRMDDPSGRYSDG
mmetsp:Transcript_64102/g.105815  ORF Transcript_64102/g.105815 Transcript_64102/m.105815 type:complete len:381 (-) Transcript_64102:48-1190(-)